MERRNYKIYAVDFDGTLCEDSWPEIGKPNDALINRVIELREEGNKIILWTCSQLVQGTWPRTRRDQRKCSGNSRNIWD